MSSLLPDDYMATSAYENLMEQAPEVGFDEHPVGYDATPLSDECLRPQADQAAPFDDPSLASASAAFATTQNMNQGVPMYYPVTSMSLPSGGFAVPTRTSTFPYQMMPGATGTPNFVQHYGNVSGQQQNQHSQQANAPHMHGFVATPAFVPASTGSFRADQYVVDGDEQHYQSTMPVSFVPVMQQNGLNRGRARNSSAPAMPVMMMMAPPMSGSAWQAGIVPSNDYNMSASYDGSHMYFPMTSERKMSTGSLSSSGPASSSTSTRSGSRSRRPSGVPALSFNGLHSSAGASSPLSASMLTPHSGRSSLSALSDYDMQFSPNTTPRSASSTPRSASTTPRSAANDKKRARTGMPHPLERERRVRPKVIAEKGALQCKGVNRKKNTRCRNAALMEYIGPRPLYCAEHITLDPDSFYSKCASAYHKVHGDGKGCREVVLKELQFCHKHYNQSLDVMLDGSEMGFIKARTQLERITTLQTQLEAEASAAKRVDPDLFQRKHKLIPKFMEMRKLLVKRMQEFESAFGHLLPTKLSEYEAPLLLSSAATASSPTTSPDDGETKFYPLSHELQHSGNDFGNNSTAEDQHDSKDSVSTTTSSPSGTSEDYEDTAATSLLMQVENPHIHQQHYSVF